MNFNYKDFTLVESHPSSEGFTNFHFTNGDNNLFIGTKRENWQDYAKEVIDNFYKNNPKFLYKSFKLTSITFKEGITLFELVSHNDYKLQGFTREDDWQSYAQQIVDDYYEYLSENLVY
jgi:hypothetical protein